MNAPAQPLARRVRRGINAAKEVVSDLPEALGQHRDFRAGKRKHAILALTWRCTSKCQSCTAWKRPSDPASELTSEQWLDVGRQLLDRGVESIELYGGDVLLRKNVVFPLVRLLDEGGCHVHMPTNSNLLDAPTAQVLAAHLYQMYLSTDGINDTHDALRGTKGSSARVHNAVELMIEARGDKPTPILISNTTVSRDNAEQVEAIALSARQQGFDRAAFEYIGQFKQEHIDRSHIGEEVPSPLFTAQGEPMLVRPKQVPVLRRQLKAASRLIGTKNKLGRPFDVGTIYIDVLSDENLVEGTVPGGPCFVEKTVIIIDPFGNVVPCLSFDKFPLDTITSGCLAGSLETSRRKLFQEYRQARKLELCAHCIQSVVRTTGLGVLRRAAIRGWRQPV